MSAFAKVQNSVQQSFADTAKNKRDPDWLPEAGWKAAIVLEDTSEREGKTQDGREYYSLTAKFTILDGSYSGRSINQDFFFTVKTEEEKKAGKPTRGEINLCNLASCLAGQTVNDFAKAVAIVKGSKGAAINANTWKSKKNPEYTNLGFNKRVDKPAVK